MQMKSRRMRWAGNVARIGDEMKVSRFWYESPNKRDHSEDRGVDGRMGSEWLLGGLAAGGVGLIGSG
jgi:hypothetical protein